MTFGEGWGATKDEARKVYETYREAEGIFIDIANVYTNGSSERFMGAHQGPPGERRAGHQQCHGANDPNAPGNHRESMTQAVDAANRLDAVQLQSRINSSLRRPINPWSSARRFTMFRAYSP